MKNQSSINYIFSCLSVILFLISIPNLSFGQNQHWVYLADKDGVYFNPIDYFDSKTIEKRNKLGISLSQYSDKPVKDEYVDLISELVDSISFKSRWLNALFVIARPEQIQKLRQFHFVLNTNPVITQSTLSSYSFEKPSAGSDIEKLLLAQTEIMGGNEFKKNDIDGSGIRIAVFDGGYERVNTSSVFKHIRESGNIIDTYDFVRGRKNVYSNNSHGTEVLSCIAGIADGKNIGLATGAEFLLARTEVNSEPFSEEKNWLAAAEWADKHGADIINSSVGYTYFRYFKKDLNGKKSLVARAATIAAKKGILVINCMGNDGNNDWEILNTPADCDSVLSVGGIDPETNLHIHFSSFGPTADKRLKPNVVAYGKTVVAGKKGLKIVTGTSYSCPLIVGFAACVWQNFPQLSNMKIFDLIQISANLFPYYDYAHGYGIPQAGYFFHGKKHMRNRTFKIINNTQFISVNSLADISIDADEIPEYLYFNIKNKNGIIKQYGVIEAYQKKLMEIPINILSSGESLTFHYKGFTDDYTIKN